LYFPFQIRRDEIRATQGYLAKMPRDVLALWPKTLSEIESNFDDTASTIAPPLARPQMLGTAYRDGDELASTRARVPFSVDPNLVDRGTRGHARTQNALAAWVRSIGAEPLSPNGEPQYDVAWATPEAFYIAEVKSITDRNEERQMRLGLGQVLRYAHLLRESSAAVVPVLMVEREPSDHSWHELCASLGVRLLWPSALNADAPRPRAD
jgi:hypothetical protein